MGANLITVTPTLDTSAYADGDVLFAPVELANAAGEYGGITMLQSAAIVDASDQGAAFDLLFFNGSSVSLGTLNAACSISDADALFHQGRVQILSSDYYDLGGCRVAGLNAIGRIMQALPTSRSLYVGGISRGTGTYAASALQLRLGFVW